MNEKPILAIETSGKICGAAVYFNDSDYYMFESSKKHSHSEKIFELIDKVLAVSGVKISELEAIAVSSGPGSFTGLRIGFSAAKGIAFGSSIPICPVPTFEAFALQMINCLPDESEFILANKVNMDELYYSRFYINGNNYIFADNLTVIRNSDLQKLSSGKLIFGENEFSKGKLSVPMALSIAAWCRKFGADLITTDYDYLEPNYLKDFIIKDKK